MRIITTQGATKQFQHFIDKDKLALLEIERQCKLRAEKTKPIVELELKGPTWVLTVERMKP